MHHVVLTYYYYMHHGGCLSKLQYKVMRLPFTAARVTKTMLVKIDHKITVFTYYCET